MTFNFMDMLTGFIVFLWASFSLLAPAHSEAIAFVQWKCSEQPTMGMEKNKARVRDEPGLFVWRVPILRQTSEPKR